MCSGVEIRLWQRTEWLRHNVRASNQRHDERTRLFVEIDTGSKSGWGEVSPLISSVGDDPAMGDVLSDLARRALPAVVDICRREGSLPLWSRSHLVANDSRADVWAWAAVEMALLDLELVFANQSLETLWAVDASSVSFMATTSLLEFDSEWLPAPAARRIRLKSGPHVEISNFRDAISSWARPVILDFNGSADSPVTVQQQVEQLESVVEVVAVEQPFATGNLVASAELAKIVGIAVSLDEGVRTVRDVRRIAQYGAATMICVKPPRVGGLAPARTILAEAQQLGLRSYVGGFFESPLARRAHACVAAGFPVEPSDVGHVVLDDGSDPADASRSIGIGVLPDTHGARLVASFRVD